MDYIGHTKTPWFMKTPFPPFVMNASRFIRLPSHDQIVQAPHSCSSTLCSHKHRPWSFLVLRHDSSSEASTVEKTSRSTRASSAVGTTRSAKQTHSSQQSPSTSTSWNSISRLRRGRSSPVVGPHVPRRRLPRHKCADTSSHIYPTRNHHRSTHYNPTPSLFLQ